MPDLKEVIALREEVKALREEKERSVLMVELRAGVPCLNCGSEMILGGNHDCEEDEAFVIVTNASCPECGGFMLFYTPDSSDLPEQVV